MESTGLGVLSSSDSHELCDFGGGALISLTLNASFELEDPCPSLPHREG